MQEQGRSYDCPRLRRAEEDGPGAEGRRRAIELNGDVMKRLLLKCLGSLVFYSFQAVCIVACSGDPPTFGVVWALGALFLGLGSTLVIAAFGPAFEFLWIIDPFEKWCH